MIQLTYSQKTLLAKLFYKDKERYYEKIKELYGDEFDVEIIDFLNREKERIDSITEKVPTTGSYVKEPETENNYIKEHTYYMGGSPYWCDTIVENVGESINSTARNTIKKSNEIVHKRNNRVLILVDGDNHIYEALEGYGQYNSQNIKIIISNNSERLRNKIKEKYETEVIVVNPGNQAVDNIIKSIIGKEARKNNYDLIAVISHDRGYTELIKRLNNNPQSKCKVVLRKRIKYIWYLISKNGVISRIKLDSIKRLI